MADEKDHTPQWDSKRRTDLGDAYVQPDETFFTKELGAHIVTRSDGYYFYDETQADAFGPFSSPEEAIGGVKEYIKSLQLPSPALQTALSEIETIIKKHDVGAFVLVHDRIEGAHETYLPTWSQAAFRPRKDGGLTLHMKVDVTEKDGNDSLRLFCGMRLIAYRAAAIFENVGKALHRHISPDTYPEHEQPVPLAGAKKLCEKCNSELEYAICPKCDKHLIEHDTN